MPVSAPDDRTRLRDLMRGKCEISRNGTSLYISKPSSRPVDPGDLASLLADNATFPVRYREIVAIAQSPRRGIFRITEKAKNPRENIPVHILIAEDESRATVVLPGNDSSRFSFNFLDLLHALRQAGVTHGIYHEALEEIVQDPLSVPDEGVVVAEMIPPVPGKDAALDYSFDPNVNYSPLRRDDGSVDFHQIDFVKGTAKDQILVTKTPASPGREGYTVTGKPIPPQEGRDLPIPRGQKTCVSDDGLVLRSECRGHVFVRDGFVHVEEVLLIQENVDYSTGDIDYHGDVIVQGNLLSQFRVRTAGNVHISKHVERSVVEAKESVFINRGIHGGDVAVVSAGKRIETGFAERASLIAGETVLARDYLIHCDIQAGSTVEVLTGKGIVLGGRIQAGRQVRCKILGSDSYGPTKIVMGTRLDESQKRQLSRIREKQSPLEAEMKRMETALQMMREIGVSTDEVEEMMRTKNGEWHGIEKEALSVFGLSDDVCVIAERRVFPGVTIVFGDREVQINQSLGPSVIRVNGGIQIEPFRL